MEDGLKSYKEALASKDFSFWNDVIQNKIYSIMSNNTLDLSIYLKDQDPIDASEYLEGSIIVIVH